MQLSNKTANKIHGLVRNVENLRGLAFVTSARNIMSLFTVTHIFHYANRLL
jgi:hypothetical protein